MKKIFLITNYKNQFGSKHFDSPYRSGMEKNVLKELFGKAGYTAEFINPYEIDFFKKDLKDQFVLYTSTEDIGYHYKSYLEDIVFGLELNGARVIPNFKYLRANNNKVMMEIIRANMNINEGKLKSYMLGTLEELEQIKIALQFPVVLKLFGGASGSNVYLAENYRELKNKIRKISRTRDVFYELWDTGRKLKHKGYKKDSLYRNKFIIQEFVPGLENDWKIYVFFDRYYIFYRPVFKKRGFRASGGGYDNYFYGKDAKQSLDIFEFAKSIYEKMDVPHASLDIAFDGKKYYLIEFQAVYFGTAGILYSNEYYVNKNNNWLPQNNTKNVENAYVHSIIKYINSKF